MGEKDPSDITQVYQLEDHTFRITGRKQFERHGRLTGRDGQMAHQVKLWEVEDPVFLELDPFCRAYAASILTIFTIRLFQLYGSAILDRWSFTFSTGKLTVKM